MHDYELHNFSTASRETLNFLALKTELIKKEWENNLRIIENLEDWVNAALLLLRTSLSTGMFSLALGF